MRISQSFNRFRCTADIQEKSKCNNFTGLTGFGQKSTEVLFCKFDHNSKQTLERSLIAMQCIGSTKGFCFVLTSYLYYKYYLIFIRFPNLNISFAFNKLFLLVQKYKMKTEMGLEIKFLLKIIEN